MFSLRNWIQKLFTACPPIRNSNPRNRLRFEFLEDRVVPAFGLSVSGTDVTFTGNTTHHDQLSLSVDHSGYLTYATSGGYINVPPTSTGVPAADVTSITIKPQGNVDHVYLDDPSLTTTAFSNPAFDGIQVDGSYGTAVYQTGSHVGALDVDFHYSGSNNGGNVFRGNVAGDAQTSTLEIGADSTAVSLTTLLGSGVGLDSYSFVNGVDVIDFGNHSGVLLTGTLGGGTHNTMNFSHVRFENVAAGGFVIDGGTYNDTITTSLHDRVAGVVYDGGTHSNSGARDVLNLSVTLDEVIDNAAAIKADFDAAKANPSGPLALSNFFHFTVQNFENVKLAVYNEGVFLGLIDNVILGTANHDSGSPYAPVLNGTAQNDLILGFGGDDILNGGGGNDILIGGNGNDTLNGDSGDDIFVYRGNDGYYDTLDGGTGTNRVVAVGAGTVVGVKHLNNVSDSIQKIEGSSAGDTVVRSSSSVHSVLNFTNVELTNIAEIDAAGNTAGNNIYVSTVSDAVYRGNGGMDVIHLQGDKTVTLPYSGPSNGFDSFVDNGFTGTATAVAETAGTVIGVRNYDNQLDGFVGHSSGDTIIQASNSVHDSLNFADTPLTNIARIETGAGNDVVTTSLHNRTAALTYDGGTYTQDQLRLSVTLDEVIDNAAAIKADFDAAKANPGGPLALSNFFNFTVQNFENVKLAVYNEGVFLGLIDNVILGTANHDSGSPYAPVLNGTAQNDLILGFGGNDTLNGGGGNDILIGGTGNDTLNGDSGDDIFVYSASDTGYDTVNAGIGYDQVIAGAGVTAIGLNGHNGDVEEFKGDANTRIQGNPNAHNTFNFTNSKFENITLIETGGPTSSDTVFISTVSDADYRGGGGNDVFHLQGDKTVTLLYSGPSNGFDTFVDNGFTGTATAVAETAGTVIGIANYKNQLDGFVGHSSGDTIIQGSSGTHDNFNFTDTPLTSIARIETGGGNDVVTTSLTRDPGQTYDGGTYTQDQLHLTVTCSELNDNAAAIAADIIAIQTAISNGWSGGPLTLSFFQFSVINFESVTLELII